MIFFHNSSDHMPFNEAPIGVPAVSFTNMPDRFIHSSDDDLWNIDATQLGRNAAAVALIAYTMASADAEMLPQLAAQTAGRGGERIAKNLGLGLSWIASAGDRETAYREAVQQLDYALERERLALTSLEGVHPAAEEQVQTLLSQLEGRRAQGMGELGRAYRAWVGREPPRGDRVTEVERELAGLRPALVAGPSEFLEARGKVASVAGLHGLMQFEVLNSVNGGRTGLEIYRFVAAEAREGGRQYYGTVGPEAVMQALRNAERAGLIRLN
jgi:Peptidase family M28